MSVSAQMVCGAWLVHSEDLLCQCVIASILNSVWCGIHVVMATLVVVTEAMCVLNT